MHCFVSPCKPTASSTSKALLLICLLLAVRPDRLFAQAAGSAVSVPSAVSPKSGQNALSLAAGAGLLIAPNASPGTATVIGIDGSVKVNEVQRLGINLGGQTYYDSGQILRNLVFRNPGFEGETFRTLIRCAAVTANSCTDTNIYAQWPASFVKGAAFQVIYGNALGVTGTVLDSTAASYAAKTGITVSFANTSKPLAKGDVVEVQMSVPGNAQAGWSTNASGGASFVTDFTDLSPHSPGKQALQINASGAGQTAELASYFDSYPGHSFVQLNGAYQVAFRAKGIGGNQELTVTLERFEASGAVIHFTQTVRLSSTWQDYLFSFSCAENGSSVGTAALKFDVAQGSVLLDDVALTPAANTQNPTAFRDEVVQALEALHPGTLRYQDANGAGLGGSIDNAIAPPFARVRTGFSEQETERDDITVGLHEFLTLAKAVGANPWYNVPIGVSPVEMQNLIEYLAGDASTPYGAKRAALGQTAPWTTVFPKIYLELGNEAWNDGTFHGATIPDPVAYGNRAATIFAAARNSPSFSAGAFNLILGSWAAVPFWTSTEMANSAFYDMVDAAPYLFNSFNDASSDEAIFGPMFAQPELVDSVSTGSMYQQAVAAQATGVAHVRPAALAVYEVQLSTLTGTAPQSAVDAVVPSLGAGLTVIEHMLLMMRDLGITVQNVYSLPEYANPFTNPSSGSPETAPLFGAVVDMGGQTNLRRPLFLAEQLANTAILPYLLNTTVSGANPTWNQARSTNDDIELAGAHYIQAFAFSDGGSKRSLILFNLSRTQSLPVSATGAGAPYNVPLSISLLNAPNLTDTNETTSTVGISTVNAAALSTGAVAYLPAHSMAVIQWTVR